MKKVMTILLAFPIFSLAQTIYTDGSKNIEICVKEKQTASIDVGCTINDIYFTNSVQAEIQKTNPKTIVFILNDKTGSITAVCSSKSYVFEIKSGRKCDLKKVIVDTTLYKKEDVKVSSFNKEETLNQARNLLVGMVKNKAVRGYDVKNIKVESIINNDDFFKIKIEKIYIGGRLIGYKGYITNFSKYVSKSVYIPALMKKGYILFYIQGMDKETVEFKPEETKQVFIVVLNQNKIPYVR